MRFARITLTAMGKKGTTPKPGYEAHAAAQPSALLDPRVICCGDCPEQFRREPDACFDLIHIDPPLAAD
jgi:hypothetical protein